jgi:hypothetical protein
LTVPVAPSGDAVAVYPLIIDPPLLDGAVNVTLAVVALVKVAVPIIGDSGTLGVVIALDVADCAEFPIMFLATTVNVYVVPGLNPVTAIVPPSAWEINPVRAPGDDVATYRVMVAPPLFEEVANEIFAVDIPDKATVFTVGALGAVRLLQLLATEFEIPALVRSSVLQSTRFVIACPLNAFWPTSETLFGIVKEVSAAAPLNAYSPIVVTSFGIIKEVRAVAFSKA